MLLDICLIGASKVDFLEIAYCKRGLYQKKGVQIFMICGVDCHTNEEEGFWDEDRSQKTIVILLV